MRRVRIEAYMRASGVCCDTPSAPCIWIAWSMILQTRSGTMALTMWIQMRASWLPRTSIALAAFSTIRRMASISMRARLMISILPPSWTSGLPNASRVRPRVTIRSSAFSAEPMARMQWWIRPGPRRSWLISKPRPSPSSMFSFGTRTLSKMMCMWPCGASGSPNTCCGPMIFTPGASVGTRICDWRRFGGPSGSVCTMVIMILQRGSPAPEM